MTLIDRARAPEALGLLRAKYVALIELRQRRGAEPGAVPPRAALRLVAQRFPGALRELEQRSMADLRQRAQALAQALEPDGVPPDWAPLQVGFHGLLRAVLALKAVMATAADGQAAARAYLDAAAPDVDSPDRSFWNTARLAMVARPPDGRPSVLVVRWIAELFEISEADVRAAVLPASTCHEL